MAMGGDARGMEAAIRGAGEPRVLVRGPAERTERKAWAIALSAVVPGLGSIAIGRLASGAWILAGWVVARITRRVHSSPATTPDPAPSRQ